MGSVQSRLEQVASFYFASFQFSPIPTSTVSGTFSATAPSILLFTSAADAAGRADLLLAVPQSPALIGVELAGQALALLPAELAFSAVSVVPVVL